MSPPWHGAKTNQRPPWISRWSSPRCGGPVNGVLREGSYGYRQSAVSGSMPEPYEGGSPGPTLRMKPRRDVRIKLINDRPPNRDSLPADIVSRICSTTQTFTSMARMRARAGIAGQRHAFDGPRPHYRHRDRAAEGHTKGTYGITPITRQRRYPDVERHGGRRRHRGRFRRCGRR